MAVVQSQGQLVPSSPPMGLQTTTYGAGTLNFYGGFTHDYAAIYRTQPNVRVCVSFFARNIAQLGLKLYRRVSETDRRQESTHAISALLSSPNPWTVASKFKTKMVSDLKIYDETFWVKVRAKDSDRLALVRIPPQFVEGVGGNWMQHEKFRLFGMPDLFVPRDRMIHIYGHNPEDERRGLSPLETIRRILAEDDAAGRYREHFWKNAARMSGVLQHPHALGDGVATRLREQFEAMYAGELNSGRTAILEEGMEFKEMTFSAKDAEYIAARKLSREESASYFHIPPVMVGILEHANFANVEQQHRMTYQDTLAPDLTVIEEELQAQLFYEFDDIEALYLEFNIHEKLKGSFEEETSALQSATGAPYMTRNEARARRNLPPVEGGDVLVIPLNVLEGGQASPTDTAPPKELPRAKSLSKARASRHIDKHKQVLRKFFDRQKRVVMSKLGNKAKSEIDEVFADERWNDELRVELFSLALLTASDFGQQTTGSFGEDFNADGVLAFLEENSRVGAENINLTTKAALAEALSSEERLEAVKHVFDIAASSRSDEIAQTKVTSLASFGVVEGGKQVGAASKQWIVTSSDPRASHAAINGETVGIDEAFSLGGKWPGDPVMDVSEVAGCTCVVEILKEEP